MFDLSHRLHSVFKPCACSRFSQSAGLLLRFT
jgi:hypothetical protein